MLSCLAKFGMASKQQIFCTLVREVDVQNEVSVYVALLYIR